MTKYTLTFENAADSNSTENHIKIRKILRDEFRYRQELFPSSDETENKIILNLPGEERLLEILARLRKCNFLLNVQKEEKAPATTLDPAAA